MDALNRIFEYFPELTGDQREKLEKLLPLYQDWNSQINVISRNDIIHFYERHVLHSLAIARFIQFPAGTKILDAGTGGGFPGIPLAIFFPECTFSLVDSIGKKIKVVDAVATALNLENVKPVWSRAEEIPESFSFVVSRAVASLDKFIPWVDGKIKPGKTAGKKHGIIYLRGDIDADLLKKYPGSEVHDLAEWFSGEFFESKKLVYIPADLNKV